MPIAPPRECCGGCGGGELLFAFASWPPVMLWMKLGMTRRKAKAIALRMYLTNTMYSYTPWPNASKHESEQVSGSSLPSRV